MSAKTVFISYRRDSAGQSFARSLELVLTTRGYDVFLDVDTLDAGKWVEQIRAEVPARSHFLLLLTPGVLDRCVNKDDWLRIEYELALSSGRNIVPVREDSVDLAQLQRDCPAAMKELFEFQIATVQHTAFERDVQTLIDKYIPPHKAPKPSIDVALRKPAAFVADISRIIKYAPAELIGREAETEILNDVWNKAVRSESKRPHVLTFVALGGEGKTSLVAKWAADLAFQDWPGCEAVFAWSFYSQGTREQTAVSSDSFLAAALTFFGDEAMANSAQGAFDKGRRLAQLVGARRALLILDGVEPLQYAPTSPTPGELKDQGIVALLKGLAASGHGLCVVTTRYAIPDLKAFWQTTAPMHELPRLSMAAGVKLLQSIGVKGRLRQEIQSEDGRELLNEFEELVEDVDGHALTIQITGQFLVRAFHGDIRQRDRIDIQKADSKIQGGHAFRAMAAYVKWLEDDSEESRRELAVLKLLGFFDRPATGDCLGALRKAPVIAGLTEPLVGLVEEDWEFSLTSLRDAKLLTVIREKGSGGLIALDAHPLLREYFAQRVHEQQPEAWRAAHERLYEHLCATTKEGDQPTLEDLQPLYQAVAHGCEAGLPQEAFNAYVARIIRGNDFYTFTKLAGFGSDLGALACFFDQFWSQLSPSLALSARGSILSLAATCLRALGRLTESLEPMRGSVKHSVSQTDWPNAAARAGNLSELELTLGDVSAAVADAEQSVTYADRSNDATERLRRRCILGDALFQAGRRDEALPLWKQGEKRHAELSPQYPLFYSTGGFRYCDLLLAEVERTAWQILCSGGPRRIEEVIAHRATLQAVSQRAAQTLKWVLTQNWLLDIALDHLTLGRAALYSAILEGSVAFTPLKRPNESAAPNDDERPSDLKLALQSARRKLDAAVDGLRRAGTTHHLPRGLLTRAWLRASEGEHTGPESAHGDLDEAWEIAERGPMRLFMADIHLYRARLFHAVKPYPWSTDADGNERGPKDDLAAAEKLINECGYHRRDEELADAKAAAEYW